MNSQFTLSLMWLLWGIIGLLGFSKIAPKKFKNKPWTKQYIRYSSFTWIIFGLPYLLFASVVGAEATDFGDSMRFLFLALITALPYSMWVERKFSARLKEENEENCPDN